MPKPATATRGGRRRKQGKKRLKKLGAEPHWLASDAPVGEYLVDTVALELFFRGATLSTYGEDEFVRLIRQDVSVAAAFARQLTRNRLVWRPEKLLLTRRLCKDVLHIQSRIRRNEGLSWRDLRMDLNPGSNR